jgi:hypothetical protein
MKVVWNGQLSAGIWALVTLNVDLLPLLSLEQWQTLFSIISKYAASSQSLAATKAFEVRPAPLPLLLCLLFLLFLLLECLLIVFVAQVVAWLLQEPRLVAKVPVFCIIVVKPLLENQLVPTTVSVGAVRLLKHLHSRLEVWPRMMRMMMRR